MLLRKNVLRYASVMFIFITMVFLQGCNSTPKEDIEIHNVFEHAIEISDNGYLINGFEFLVSSATVMEQKKLDDDAMNDDELTGARLMSNITIESLGSNIVETYIFQDDKLISLEYYIPATTSDFEDICHKVYEQAKSYMPLSDSNKLEDIADGYNSVDWYGDDNSHVSVSFPMTEPEELKVIVLSVNAPK